jgi:PIN domain nuclease of toxin-antitoxin system
MRLLLDTHTLLWFIDGSTRLSPRARALIEDEANDIYLSVVSLWEIAIKISLGKLRLTQPFELLVPQQLGLNAITLLDISINHASHVITLPFHHRDPFDRLLIAQAQVEQMPIVGNDPAFDPYPITRMW